METIITVAIVDAKNNVKDDDTAARQRVQQ